MTEELLEQFQSYFEICKTFGAEPTFTGFARHLIESYEVKDGPRK